MIDKEVRRMIYFYGSQANEEIKAGNGSVSNYICARVNNASTPPIDVSVSSSLTERLLHTSIDEMIVGDVKLAFDAFVLKIPKGVSQWIKYVGIANAFIDLGKKSPSEGLGFLYFVLCNGWGVSSKIMGDDALLSEAFKEAPRILDAKITRKEWARVHSFSVGTCLYMATESAEVTCNGNDLPRHDGLIVLPPVRTKQGLRFKQRERKAQRVRSFVAGVSLPPLIAHANTIVRGHFRRQAHGPNRSLRKIMWIQPHLRFRDDSFPTVGRDIEG